MKFSGPFFPMAGALAIMFASGLVARELISGGGWFRLPTSSEWAAWVQAVGTLIALGIAVDQGRRAAIRESERDQSTASAAHSLVQNASQVVVHMHSDIIANRVQQAITARRLLDGGQLSELAGALNAFDVTRLRNKTFVTSVLVAQRAVREFRQALEDLAVPPAVPLIVREIWPPVETIQRAASLMVEDLVILSNSTIGFWGNLTPPVR